MLSNGFSIPKKYIVVGLCIIMLLIVTLLVYFIEFSDTEADLKDNIRTSYKIEMIYEEGEDEYWVVNEDDTKQRWLYENGEPSYIISMLATSPTEPLELPKTKKSKDITLNEDSKLDNFTYTSTLEDSAKYLNFLVKEGYSIKREVSTQSYIEVILLSDTREVRRIIIQEGIIMLGTVNKGTELPKLEDYLNKYKVTGGESAHE